MPKPGVTIKPAPLVEARLSRALSYRGLCQLIQSEAGVKVDAGTLYHIETGAKRPGPGILAAWCKVLALDPAGVIVEEEPEVRVASVGVSDAPTVTTKTGHSFAPTAVVAVWQRALGDPWTTQRVTVQGTWLKRDGSLGKRRATRSYRAGEQLPAWLLKAVTAHAPTGQ